MNRRKKTAALALLLAAALLNTAFTSIEYEPNRVGQSATQVELNGPTEEEAPRFTAEELALMKKLNGRWQGNFRVVTGVDVVTTEDGKNTTRHYYNDGVTMDFVYDEKDPQLYLKVESCPANYLLPREWHLVNGDTLVFTFNDKPWQAVVTLKLGASQILSGTYRQSGQNMTLLMRRTLAAPVNYADTPQFMFEGEPDSTWTQRLEDAPSYAENGGSIAYKYELGVNSKNTRINSMYNITKLTAGKTELQKMELLLNLVCDNFPHDGASGMPEKTDALSCIKYSKDNDGIECRGLASILAEMCRMAGIAAKPVMCIPSNDPCEDCHVVVQAYSQALGQWVMLDPTYRLMLRDARGRYLGLEEIREALIYGDKLVANDNAGRNSSPFYMEYYRAYMTKNMFRFSDRTQFGYDAADKSGNMENMLLPLGYTIPFLQYRTERLTTCASEFWAAPTGLPPLPVTPVKPAAPAGGQAGVGTQSQATPESSEP